MLRAFSRFVTQHAAGVLVAIVALTALSIATIVDFRALSEGRYSEAVRVRIDPDNAIPEADEGNNEASQLLRVGQPDPSAVEIVVQAAPVSTCQGKAVSVGGRADRTARRCPMR